MREPLHKFHRRAGRATAAVTLLVTSLGLLLWACRPPKEPAPPQPALLRTPRETVAKLLEARRGRLYHEVGALLVPGRSRETVAFLMRLDEFVAANDRLCAWVRDRIGVAQADMIDQGYITDDLAQYAGEGLGIFSRHVELLDVRTSAGRATVSYCVPGRLIAREVQLRREPTGWRLDPGSAATDQLVAAFKSLAEGIESVRSELEAGYDNTADPSQDPMRLVEKVQLRLRPGVALLSRAQAAAQAAAATQAAAAPPSPRGSEGPGR